MAQGDKPVKEFRAGSVRASIWQDKAIDKNHEPFNVYSVRVEKRYRDAAGNWQSAKRFSRTDLADVELVVFQARQFIALATRQPSEG
jgi:hypothetical protein